MARLAIPLSLSVADQQIIEELLCASSTPQQVALRCRILLAATRDQQNLEIAAQEKVNRHTVALWRKRVAAEGIGCMWQIKPQGRGRKQRYDPASGKPIIEAPLQSKVNGITHWTCRLSAAELRRVEPGLSREFKRSGDPQFLEKLTDVVALYLNPPQKTVVICGDAQSWIQSLDRTQLASPLKKSRRDDLIMQLSVLDRKVMGQCEPGHRQEEFLKFLRRLDQEFPGEGALHLVMDNNGSDKSPEVQEWRAQHPRFEVHFVPTGSSWVDSIERWIEKSTLEGKGRGAFVSLKYLCFAVPSFLDDCFDMSRPVERPRPFVWTAPGKTAT